MNDKDIPPEIVTFIKRYGVLIFAGIVTAFVMILLKAFGK